MTHGDVGPLPYTIVIAKTTYAGQRNEKATSDIQNVTKKYYMSEKGGLDPRDPPL